MYEKLQGFKQFFEENEVSPVRRESGMTELTRLERGHYLFTIPTNHKLAEAFMKGYLLGADFMKSSPSDLAGIENQLHRLTAERNSLVIVAVPKRWERQLGRVDFHEQFGKMIGNSGRSAQYVWGVYSLWNPRLEENDGGNFFRNPRYHANDDILESWLKEHPQPSREKPAVPLDRQPRIFGQHLLDQGRHAFHGYKDSPSIQTD